MGQFYLNVSAQMANVSAHFINILVGHQLETIRYA